MPTNEDLQAIATLVYRHSGIAMHTDKRHLVAARLQKRLRETKLSSFGDYVKRVEQDTTGDELTVLLDCMSTNHTSFFREKQHFDILAERVVPWLLEKPARAAMRGWCAACSSGEEAYSIAITFLDHLAPKTQSGVALLASDISTQVLRKARTAIYPIDRVKEMPPETLKKHFDRGFADQEGMARVKPAARQMVEFCQINLLDAGRSRQPFEFIFCRNVMMYFDKVVQQRVISMLEGNLARDGWLFIGHAENLNGIEHSLKCVAPAVFRKVGA